MPVSGHFILISYSLDMYQSLGSWSREASPTYGRHSIWSSSWVELRFMQIYMQMYPHFQTVKLAKSLFGKRSYIRQGFKFLTYEECKGNENSTCLMLHGLSDNWILLFDNSRENIRAQSCRYSNFHSREEEHFSFFKSFQDLFLYLSRSYLLSLFDTCSLSSETGT